LGPVDPVGALSRFASRALSQLWRFANSSAVRGVRKTWPGMLKMRAQCNRALRALIVDDDAEVRQAHESVHRFPSRRARSPAFGAGMNSECASLQWQLHAFLGTAGSPGRKLGPSTQRRSRQAC